MKLELRILKDAFAIHRLNPDEMVPDLVFTSEFFWIGKTDEELSVVCASTIPITGSKINDGWSCLKVVGPLDLSLTGVLAGLSSTLAKAAISLFAISTFDTDYILVKSIELDKAIQVLQTEGYEVGQAI